MGFQNPRFVAVASELLNFCEYLKSLVKLACYPCGVLFEAIAAAKDFSKRSRQSIQRITFYHWVRLVAGASQCIMQEHKPELLNKKRSSSDKHPGETESQDLLILKGTLMNSRNNQKHLPWTICNPQRSCRNLQPVLKRLIDNMRNLTEKLSAALLNITSKEDIVKQRAKVAEEAVSGWNKAEDAAVAFKEQLETAALKNSALEDRVGHLEGDLKECVRQLRQARDKQEQKFHEAVIQTKVKLKRSEDGMSKEFPFDHRSMESFNMICYTSMTLFPVMASLELV
ncbi:hypothetical protein C5167_004587 [Papaver somniferum]|uniref:Uncharacterized protein n=1 Tax=Papaver somniferum TaxID=3469 RepID=A0A4Y7JCB7_PAPSO|nr:hypothetical protein C5167_004587 [Papaver somniferum]